MADLVIENLSKSFGGTPVLRDVSLEVPDGGFTIILGPSGCGKSTLLRLVAGLEEPDQGDMRIGGQSVLGLAPRKRDLAMVFQSYALYPHLTVAENLAFALKMRGEPKETIQERVAQAAGLLGIEELLGARPRQLSGGQRQRVAIGRAIVREPRLFLFDEPLSNLDAQLRSAMRVELARLHRRLKATMIYVTHDQVEAMTLGREIVVLAQGRIQQRGAPEDIYARPANPFVAGFVGSPAMNFLEGEVVLKDGGPHLAEDGTGLSIPLPAWAAEYQGLSLTVGVRPEDLTPDEGPFRGRLELVERLGHEGVWHLDLGGVTLRAMAPGRDAAQAGDEVGLGVAPEALHLFHDDRRLGPEGRGD